MTSDIDGNPFDWEKWINEFFYNAKFSEISTFDKEWRKFLNKKREQYENLKREEQNHKDFKDDD